MAEVQKFEYLKGDKVLWALVIGLSFLSLFPVYSASSNLEYIVHNGTTTSHMMKHLFVIIFGLFMARAVGMIRYEFIGKISAILLGISIVFLLFASASGDSIDGASAARWIKIPGVPMTIQPSAFAFLFLVVYLCRYLGKKRETEPSVWEHILSVFVPILLVVILVGKDNGSTAIMILTVSIIILFIGKYPMKLLLSFLGISFAALFLFVMIALNTTWIKNNRVNTWKSRIEVFMSSKEKTQVESEADKAKNYQSMQARAAIVHGGITGMGPGKSALKQMLPQSASDFIFAIIVEEYGALGAGLLLMGYALILIRIVMIASKMPALFGTLLVVSLGVMLLVQISVNVAVAVNLIPVTGQPLPLISYGGSSMLVSYILFGLILNVSSRVQILDEEGLGSNRKKLGEIHDIA